MLSALWSAIRRIFGMDASWEMMTLSRIGIDPVSARSLTQVLQPSPTIRLRPEREVQTAPEADGIEVTWHGITDVGMARTQNEDSLLLLDLGNDALFAVADGMGGHDAGEVASGIAIETVRSEVQQGRLRMSDPSAIIERSIRQANAAVKQEAALRGSNMGTTLTAVLVADDTAYIGSVGDSRVYWLENGSLTQITQDHSLVAKLVAAGKLTKDEARTDPRSNLLYRTIGSEDEVAVDTYRLQLRKGCTLLLCTDGLWGEVSDAELRRICVEEQHTDILCARLVQQANGNGGRDNITAIAVKVI